MTFGSAATTCRRGPSLGRTSPSPARGSRASPIRLKRPILSFGSARSVRGVAGARHERADVAEGRQPRPHLGVDVASRPRRGALTNAWSIWRRRAIIRSPSARRSSKMLRRFARVRSRSYSSGPRRVDRLVAARPQRAQLAPAVVVQGIHRLGVALEAQLPRFAPVISGTRLPPARPAGAGTPSRSSTVGIRSTTRTGSATRRARVSSNGARTMNGTRVAPS